MCGPCPISLLASDLVRARVRVRGRGRGRVRGRVRVLPVVYRFVFGQYCVLLMILGRTSEHLVTIPSTHTFRVRVGVG